MLPIFICEKDLDPRWGFCGCWTARIGKAKSIENMTISKNTNADTTNM
nr:MAG TPA: hypothetical protein [Caudoviricetes sp.]DAY11106.1 MAG TPA: hypothetical protein [Caudoviricetes sp.]